MPTRFFAPIARLVLAAIIFGGPVAAPALAIDIGGFFKPRQLPAHTVPVDTGEAVRMLAAYRRQHGLPAVTLDPKLTRIAADHALKMATADKVAHVLHGEGSFPRRLRAGGYDAAVAAENIGAGYDTLAEAFAGWRKSREHNKNLLRPGVTAMGIARADSDGSKYGSYWSLIVASPYEGPEGPSAGPPGVIIGQ